MAAGSGQRGHLRMGDCCRMIHVEHATYAYPASSQPALRDINLDIAAGSFVAVAGANGAGKSTLCALLAGFVPHHFGGTLKGHVVVDGIETAKSNLNELVRHIGLVFQNPYNQISGARLSVASEVAFGLENTGVPREICCRVCRRYSTKLASSHWLSVRHTA